MRAKYDRMSDPSSSKFSQLYNLKPILSTLFKPVVFGCYPTFLLSDLTVTPPRGAVNRVSTVENYFIIVTLALKIFHIM